MKVTQSMVPAGASVMAASAGRLTDLGRVSRMALFTLLFAVSGLAAQMTWAADEQVNINTASAEELSSALSGVGLAKARRIVEYRELHGPFEHIDELAEVRGIGDSTVDKNRPRISLE